jgi:hypothetical protein
MCVCSGLNIPCTKCGAPYPNSRSPEVAAQGSQPGLMGLGNKIAALEESLKITNAEVRRWDGK